MSHLIIIYQLEKALLIFQQQRQQQDSLVAIVAQT